MKLSIWSSYYIELSPEEAVERFCANGIYCSELSDEHGLALLERDENIIKTAKEFAGFLKDHNFEMPQGHLWLRAKICSDDTAVDTLRKWIDLYEAIGIKNMVLHCDALYDTDLSKEEVILKNVDKLKILAKYIENKDITVCLENLTRINRNADDILDIIDRVNSPKLGVCLDTGHLNLTEFKDQSEFILKANDKLKALHIANNDGTSDQHTMPFARGSIDFEKIVKALKTIGYDGAFNLEIPGENRIPIELRDAKIAFIKAGFDYLMNL